MRLPFLGRRAAMRTVDCRQVGAWLQAYLDGELDETRTTAVERHLKACLHCGMEAETYRQLKASLRRQAVPTAETDAVRRLRRFAERLAAGEIDAHGEVDPLS